MLNFINLEVKACELNNTEKQVHGFYICAISDDNLEHRVLTGLSQDLDLSDNNPKFKQCICASYVTIDVNTLRRNTGLKDITGRILYERDMLISDTGEFIRIEIKNDEPVLVFLAFDSCTSSNVQEIINDHKLQWISDPYTNIQ